MRLYFLQSFFHIRIHIYIYIYQANGTANLMGLIQPLTLMFWSFFFMYIYSDFGERISGGFDAIHSVIEECDWYLFTIGMQKMLLIIMIVDEPVVVNGFPNVALTRESFKKVLFILKSMCPKTIKSILHCADICPLCLAFFTACVVAL